MVDLVGYLAGFLMAFAFMPQAIKSIKTKDTSSISLPSQVIYLSAAFLWFVYGILLHNGPMVFWNLVTICVVGAVLAAKLKYG